MCDTQSNQQQTLNGINMKVSFTFIRTVHPLLYERMKNPINKDTD